jgi:hypothetical protein
VQKVDWSLGNLKEKRLAIVIPALKVCCETGLKDKTEIF